LFYNFSLDRHVPADHLLRSIDRFVDFGDLRRHLAPFYSQTDRPSVDPELMIRMLIIGYCLVSEALTPDRPCLGGQCQVRRSSIRRRVRRLRPSDDCFR
jgi:hypothetical protein